MMELSSPASPPVRSSLPVTLIPADDRNERMKQLIQVIPIGKKRLPEYLNAAPRRNPEPMARAMLLQMVAPGLR